MTLVEMLMGIGVGSLVLAGLMGTTVFTARTFVGIGNYCDLNQGDRHSADLMSQDIRQANALSSYTTNKLVFQTTDATSGATNTLIFAYDPSVQTLTRTLGTQTNVLITNCIYCRFDLFQRDPSPTNAANLAAYNPSNGVSHVKAIDFTWICQKSVMGISHNSASVQSERVIIRK